GRRALGGQVVGAATGPVPAEDGVDGGRTSGLQGFTRGPFGDHARRILYLRAGGGPALAGEEAVLVQIQSNPVPVPTPIPSHRIASHRISYLIPLVVALAISHILPGAPTPNPISHRPGYRSDTRIHAHTGAV
ncbi:hypothetical protein B7494_g3082, partial [Chlorociboria aeruginascens]